MRSPSENGAVSPLVISTGHLHSDSDLVSCVEVPDSQPTHARVRVASLSSHVPMPSSYSVGLCPYLGHLKGYLHLRGHGVGWELSKNTVVFICGCSSVPRGGSRGTEPGIFTSEAWGGGTDSEIKILSLPYQSPQKPVLDAVLTPSQPGYLNISVFSTVQASKSQLLSKGL